jgi:hypothetical protein
MNYFIHKNNQQLGPYTIEQVKALLASSEITKADLCWHDKLTTWVPVGTLEDLNAATVIPQLVSDAPSVSVAEVPAKSSPDTASFVLGIIACSFSGVAALWSFFGGACCGWLSWGWAGIGFVLAIISLSLKQSTLGWVALGLAIFSFLWVIFLAVFWVGLSAAAGAGAPHQAFH